MTPTQRSGPRHEAASTNSATHTVSGVRTGRYATVYASAYEACGERKRPVAITRLPCPFGCGGRHIHFVPPTQRTGVIRRAGCGRGTYRVMVTRVYRVRAAVTP